jgi:hypothetical protein
MAIYILITIIIAIIIRNRLSFCIRIQYTQVELLRHLAERCRAHMFFAVRALSRRAEWSRPLNVPLPLVTMNSRFMCVRFV